MVLIRNFSVILILSYTILQTCKANKLPTEQNQGIIQRHEVLLENVYEVRWTVDLSLEEVLFNISVKTKGYVGFGISYTGSMKKSDIIIGGVFSNGSTYFSDRHGVGNMEPLIDKSQDWKLLEATENDGLTNIVCKRKLDTCDENDIAITDDTFKIIWSYGKTDEIKYHGVNRGVLVVNFKDPISNVTDISNFKIWRIAQPYVVPGVDTTYWCTFFKGPQISKKHHVVGFDVYLNGTGSKKHTHHAELYKCTSPNGENADDYFGKYLGPGYDCYFSKQFFPQEHCQFIVFLWTIGGRITMFPENVGVPIGEGGSEYYMTELHYDNPDKLTGVGVHSGLEIYYSETLRQHDAGFLSLAVKSSKTYSLTLPPNSRNFVVNSHCSPQCTEKLKPSGIYIFTYILHSHLSGRKEGIRHYRKGKELPWMAYDDNYDFNYQTNRILKNHLHILPGDQLTLECTYDTNWKKGLTTIGGRSARDEMCQTFIIYYPRDDNINQCGSYFPQKRMLDYMGVEKVTAEKGVIDPTILLPEKLKGTLYSHYIENMNWTTEKRAEFQKLIRFSSQEAYCYPCEDHENFVDMQYPKVDKEFHPPPRNCTIIH